MNKRPSQIPVNRRQFLNLLALAGVTATGGYALFEYRPWLDYDQQADQTWKSFATDPAVAAHMRELVRYATLAASGHNTQPWKFAVTDNAIEIHPDYARRVFAVDPHDRELWISLGCALENLLVAARAVGYASDVTYPDTADFIHIRLTTDTAQGSPLFDAIPLRQNTRSDYDGQPIKRDDLAHIHALPLEPGIVLRFVDQPTELETVLEYVNQGNLRQYGDTAFVAELIDWLRFSKKEALASLDGLYSRCSGNPDVPRWIGEMFVNGTTPRSKPMPMPGNCVAPRVPLLLRRHQMIRLHGCVQDRYTSVWRFS